MVRDSTTKFARFSRTLRLLWATLSIPLATACVGEDSEVAHQGPIDLASFAVSDFFTPSGHMGDGQEPGHIVMQVNEGCRNRPLGARGSCYAFTYGPPGKALWAGVFWAFPANNWGAEPGRLFKPWVFDQQAGVIRQRYNRIRLAAAARRDTFEIAVRSRVQVGDQNVCYTLRNAVFEIAGGTTVTVDSEATLARSPAPTEFTPCPEAKARVVLPPGWYNMTLRSGFTVEVDGAAASSAQPVENPLRFRLFEDRTTAGAFNMDVDGQLVRFEVQTPPLQVAFFAGGIRDASLDAIRCPEEGRSCRYQDNVLTGGPKSISVSLSRELTVVTIPSSVLAFAPPCVQNTRGEIPARDDASATITCPAGTWTRDGLVATCPLGLLGALQKDGNILCCDGGNPVPTGDGTFNCGTNDYRDPDTGEFISTPKPTFTGSWRHVEDIEGTLVGAFGWSTSYSEFETEPGSGQLALDEKAIPLTYIYLDDIVWDYAPETAP